MRRHESRDHRKDPEVTDLEKIQEIFKMMATVSAVAIVFFSCRSKLYEAEVLDLERTPLQVVDSMYLVQSSNGAVTMRVLTGRMEKYEKDSISYELFPEGISVYAYKDDGVLESTIFANSARHDTPKGVRDGDEIWMATDNVIVRNMENGQTIETDTLYWDRKKGEIYTDSYIRLYSFDGFAQGYGMRSDERARNAIIERPFNNYAIVVKDTAEVIIDTANFIGPILKKR